VDREKNGVVGGSVNSGKTVFGRFGRIGRRMKFVLRKWFWRKDGSWTAQKIRVGLSNWFVKC